MYPAQRLALEEKIASKAGKTIANTLHAEITDGTLVVREVKDFDKRYGELYDENPDIPDKLRFLYFWYDVRNVVIANLKAMV